MPLKVKTGKAKFKLAGFSCLDCNETTLRFGEPGFLPVVCEGCGGTHTKMIWNQEITTVKTAVDLPLDDHSVEPTPAA